VRILLGFDPGGDRRGVGGFGCCVAECAERLPLRIRMSGRAQHAQGAFDAVIQHVDSSDTVIGAGIDAPLFWVFDGNRKVDGLVRGAIRDLGSPGSTVQEVNSLRGACLVQGILVGLLLRSRYPDLPITESHPKALLWMIGEATVLKPAKAITLTDLHEWFLGCSGDETEEERDAALATLGAWAMVHQATGWQDLFRLERRPVLPLAAPISYWMPNS
jgi:hypothetical protein